MFLMKIISLAELASPANCGREVNSAWFPATGDEVNNSDQFPANCGGEVNSGWFPAAGDEVINGN